MSSNSILKKTLAIWILTAAYPALFYFLLGLMEAIGSSNISFTDALMGCGLLAFIMSGYIALVWGPVNSILVCILWIFNICHIQFVKKWVLFTEPLFFLLFVLIYNDTLYSKVNSFFTNHFPGIFDYDSILDIYFDSFLSTILKWCIPVLFTGLFLLVIQLSYRYYKKYL